MSQLHWNKLSAGRWELRDEQENLWASVEPIIDGLTGEPVKRKGRGIFAQATHRAKCERAEINLKAGYDNDARQYWVCGSGVAQAKRRIEGWLHRYCWEGFEVVSLNEPAFIPTLAGLRAIGAVLP